MLSKAQITTLRRAAALLYDLGEERLSADLDHYVDVETGRLDEDGKLL